jgi:hypothetical protein
MADIGVSDLEAFAKTIAANDIFSTMADPLIAFRPDTFTAVAGDPSVGVYPKVRSMSPWESLATTFATSLGGGLLKNYGKAQEAEQIAALTNVLPQLIADPTSVAMPEGIESGAFNSIKQKAIAARAEREARKGDAAFAAMLTNPVAAKQSKRLFGIDVAKLAGLDTPAAAMAGVLRENAADLEVPKTIGDKPEGETKLSPMERYNKTLDETGDETLAKAAYASDAKSNEDRIKGADDLRTQFIGLQEVKDTVKLGRLYKTLAETMDNPSAVADIPFIVGFIKAGDPTSVVRETESGAVLESSGLPLALQARLNKYMSGEGNLPQRQELFDLIGNYYGAQKAITDDYAERYTKIANKRGIDPEDVIVLPKLPEVSSKSVKGASDLETQLIALRDQAKIAREKGDTASLLRIRKQFESVAGKQSLKKSMVDESQMIDPGLAELAKMLSSEKRGY